VGETRIFLGKVGQIYPDSEIFWKRGNLK